MGRRPLHRSLDRHRLAAALLLALAATASLARADAIVEEPWPRLFRGAGFASLENEAARRLVMRLDRACSYSPFSRIGPRPGEVARCNRAGSAALAVGLPAARAAMALLDRPGLSDGARYRMYDLIARHGDEAAIEPLVTGLARAAATTRRDDEAAPIAITLRALTHAAVGDDAPWVSSDEPGLRVAARWRAWLDAHQGRARGELFAERAAAARQQLDGAPAEAFVAARFLARHPATWREGRDGLRRLLERADSDAPWRDEVAAELERAARPPDAARAAIELQDLFG